MEDMERYGDYNELEEIPGKKNFMSIVIRILVAVVILLVVGVLGFRLVLFEYYPKSIKNVAFTDKLTAYYNQTNGDIGAKTQRIRFPYDNSAQGNFFSDYLILIDGIDQLQISLRMNVSTLETIEQKYGFTEPLSRDEFSYFTFRLYDNEDRVLGTLSAVQTDSVAMYRYFKLVFDGVDLFEREDGATPSKWIRVEVYVEGADSEEPFAMLPIYENNDEYSEFTDYALSRKEKP